MSLRASAALPRITSGDMYASVPAKLPPHQMARPIRRVGESATRQTGGNPEVEDLDVTIGRDHHVGRLEVAVNDAAIVRMRERRGNLRRISPDAVYRETRSPDHRRQALTLDEFHDQERVAVGLVHLVKMAGVGV